MSKLPEGRKPLPNEWLIDKANTLAGNTVGNKMTVRRYYQGIGYPSDMEEHDEYGDWVKWEDVEPLLERINELERQLQDKK